MNLGRDAELEMEVEKPPVLIYREGKKKTVTEQQCLVGWIDYSMAGLPAYTQAKCLRDMGIYMDLAVYDEESGRWERVLFSEEVADMLVELDDEKQLPFAFEAGPSKGGLCVLWDRLAKPETERPPLKLRAYIVPAGAAELDVLASGGVHSEGLGSEEEEG